MALDAFGKLLRDIRITRSLLLKDMADMLDMSSAKLSAIEVGRSPIPENFISQVKGIFGIGDRCAHQLEIFARQRQLIAEGFWCENQSKDNNGIYCTAHLHEDRVFDCPYENLEARLKSSYPCSDYRALVVGISF